MRILSGNMVGVFLIAVGVAACVEAQDPRWMRMWDRAQAERPHEIESVARIADESEPGTPLVIHGRVYDEDGVTPLPGVIVFAYQTDEGGVYHPPGASDWRLRGWAKSDEKGRFEFRTVRPGSYPDSRVPAHVHLTIEGPDVPRQWVDELRFGDDPLLSREARRRAEHADRFTSVRPVTIRDGVQHVDLNLRVTGEGRF